DGGARWPSPGRAWPPAESGRDHRPAGAAGRHRTSGPATSSETGCGEAQEALRRAYRADRGPGAVRPAVVAWYAVQGVQEAAPCPTRTSVTPSSVSAWRPRRVSRRPLHAGDTRNTGVQESRFSG